MFGHLTRPQIWRLYCSFHTKLELFLPLFRPLASPSTPLPFPPLPSLQHQSEYELLLTSQSSSTGVKRLAASFVVKFSPLFPSLVVQALDCLCDLLEDEDSAVRGRVVLLSVGKGGGGGMVLLCMIKGPVCTS